MTTYPLPANLFNSLAYFYANASGALGAFSKATSEDTLVRVNYKNVITGLIYVSVVSFVVDKGSAPPLMISNIEYDDNSLLFIISEGVQGVSYTLTITVGFSNGETHVDTLGVNVPSEAVRTTLGITNTINVGNPITGNGAVFINSGPRYFVNDTPPAGANLLDIWYNSGTKRFYMYVTDGTSNFWWLPINEIPSVVSEQFYMESLTVNGVNSVTPLTYTPDGNTFVLTVNEDSLLPLGAEPPFSISGKNIVWLSDIYSVNIGDTVRVFYSYPSSTPITYVPPSSLSATEQYYMENLTVTAVNTVSALANIPDNNTLMLIINGETFIPRGANPPFKVTGVNIVWLSTTFTINLTDTVNVYYSSINNSAHPQKMYTEKLSVTAIDTLTPLSFTPNKNVLLLIINGRTFIPRGSFPPFSVTGVNINWLSTLYNINLTDDVEVLYTYDI